MSSVTDVLLLVGGLLLIGFALRDMWHTILHPAGHGHVSALVGHWIWRIFRWAGSRRTEWLTLAGPTALVAVFALWTICLAAGWSLVYLPFMPEHFELSNGLNPDDERGFIDALYFSMVTLATLGYGDIVPVSDWLRILAPLEAAVGFGLLTVGVSWLMSLYPILGHRRALAHEVTLLRETAQQTGINVLHRDSQLAEGTLADLTTRLIQVRGDLLLMPVAYYFHNRDEDGALELSLPYLRRLAQLGENAEVPEPLRFRAILLNRALEDLTGVLAHDFLHCPGAPVDEVLARYAADRLRIRDKEDLRRWLPPEPDAPGNR